MHILYITQSGFGLPSAETTHTVEMIKSFIKLDHKVTVAYAGSGKNIGNIPAQKLTYKHNRLIPWKIGFQLWLFFVLFKNRKDKKYDKIYVRQSALMFAPSIVKGVLNCQLISEFNTVFSKAAVSKWNIFLYLPIALIEKLVIKRSDQLVVVSKNLFDVLTSIYPRITKKIQVVNNGCNLDFMQIKDKWMCRKKYGLASESFVVGFVGHLHPWQGVDVLIQAISYLKVTDKKVLALIAGTSNDELYYRKMAQNLGVENEVIFLGAMPYEEIPFILSCFDIGVAPGSHQGDSNYSIRSPLKVYEYLANGKPVISGYLPALDELFQHNIGYLITPGNVEELVRRVKDILSDEGLLHEMGHQARIIAEKRLSWDSVAMKILSFKES